MLLTDGWGHKKESAGQSEASMGSYFGNKDAGAKPYWGSRSAPGGVWRKSGGLPRKGIITEPLKVTPRSQPGTVEEHGVS